MVMSNHRDHHQCPMHGSLQRDEGASTTEAANSLTQ
jgi:hypothetical protein